MERAGRPHPSIVDVARAAGVSASTVSRALRGLPHVGEQTRLRVAAAARDLDYVASPAGTGLASGRTHTVGVVVPLVTRWFFAQVLAAVEAVLRTGGYDVLLYNLGEAAGRTRFFERMPMRRRVDAVLLVSLPLSGEEVDLLRSLDVPVVTVGTAQPEFSGVRIDDAAGAALAVRHLSNLGHGGTIAMISALEDDDLGFAAAGERRAGFRRAVGSTDSGGVVVSGTWGIDGGARAMTSLLSSERLPTAVFAEYDEMAFGALLTLRRAGLDVPRDLSIVGFDDHEMAAVADPTTVAQPVSDQGEIAGRLLLDGLRAGAAGAAPVDVVLPTWLVIRGSTAPARTDLARRAEPTARRPRPSPGGTGAPV